MKKGMRGEERRNRIGEIGKDRRGEERRGEIGEEKRAENGGVKRRGGRGGLNRQEVRKEIKERRGGEAD